MKDEVFDQLASDPVLGKFYGLVRRLFGVNIHLVDIDATRSVSMGPKSVINPFCAMLHENTVLKKRCMECDRQHIDLVRRSKKALRYRCHAGLTEFVIPIMRGPDIVAFLLSGQVLDSKPSKKSWSRAEQDLAAVSMDPARLRPPFFKTLVMPPSMQKDYVAMLELFANYIAQIQQQLILLEEARSTQIVGRARMYIKDHIGDEICLEDIARAAYTSKRNLTRVFRKETGITVVKLVQQCRIDHACDLLKHTENTCAAIAFESGFGSIQQFDRVFKQIKGMTPVAWRHAFLSSRQADKNEA